MQEFKYDKERGIVAVETLDDLDLEQQIAHFEWSIANDQKKLQELKEEFCILNGHDWSMAGYNDETPKCEYCGYVLGWEDDNERRDMFTIDSLRGK